MRFKRVGLKLLSVLPLAGLSFTASQALAEESARDINPGPPASNANLVASSSSTGSGTEDLLEAISSALEGFIIIRPRDGDDKDELLKKK